MIPINKQMITKFMINLPENILLMLVSFILSLKPHNYFITLIVTSQLIAPCVTSIGIYHTVI